MKNANEELIAEAQALRKKLEALAGKDGDSLFPHKCGALGGCSHLIDSLTGHGAAQAKLAEAKETKGPAKTADIIKA